VIGILTILTAAIVVDELGPHEPLSHEEWGRFSRVRGPDGRLLVVHHGSGADIEDFSYDFTDIGSDQHGSGFYFTTDLDEARGYTVNRKEADLIKLGGEGCPTILHTHLDIRDPLDSEAVGDISLEQVLEFIRQAPSDNWLVDWGDVKWEGRDSVITRAAGAYAVEDSNLVRALFSIANDMYSGQVEAFNRAVLGILGHDGVVHRLRGGGAHYIAFFPEQIRVVGRTRC